MTTNRNACATTAVVLGLDTVTALGVVRSLGIAHIKVIGVNVGPRLGLAAYSRFCTRLVDVGSARQDEIVTTLVQAVAQEERLPVLFATTDPGVLFIHSNATALAQHFRLSLSTKYPIADLLDKNQMARMASKAGVRVPRTHTVRLIPHELRDTGQFGELRYPVIAKPVDSLSLGKSDFVLAKDPADLVYSLRKKATNQLGLTFVIQEYVPGADRCVIEAFALNVGGKVHVPCMAFKHRVYPPVFGSSSYIETFRDPILETLVARIVAEFEFPGAVDVELKRDSETGEIYFIEMNYRAGAPIWLATMGGANLPATVALSEDSSASSLESARVRSGLRWFNEETDWANAYHRRVGWGTLIRQAWQADAYALWHRLDPAPALVAAARLSAHLTKRAARKFLSR